MSVRTSPHESECDEQVFDEVSEYTKIEQHMSFSRGLYLLKKKGKGILEQFDQKKYQRKTKKKTNVFSHDASIIYNNLSNIVNRSRHSLQLSFCLQYYLDELMFVEIKNLHTFIVEDQHFDLTKLYYYPSEWMQDQETQCFEFYSDCDLNMHEAMYLVCYIKDFENFLLEIEDYLKTHKDSNRIKKKVLRVANRIRLKFRVVWDVIIGVINSNFST